MKPGKKERGAKKSVCTGVNCQDKKSQKSPIPSTSCIEHSKDEAETESKMMTESPKEVKCVLEALPEPSNPA